MSKARKHVFANAMDADIDLEDGDHIARVSVALGNDQWEAELADGTVLACRLPSKFKKAVWIKNNSFVVSRIAPADASGGDGARRMGEIRHILFERHVRALKAKGQWPAAFEAIAAEEPQAAAAAGGAAAAGSGSEDGSQSHDSLLDDLLANPNRRVFEPSSSD
eukprot:c27042_g1_i1.p1 GENE.c27042_g1_i1~~c27042_g1_i1.p1  ORF type:complete len:171 (-),score=24.61 c27042_g1_i1:297-788(-)